MRLARNSSSSHNANGIYVEQLHSGAAFARGLKSALASCKTLARALGARGVLSTNTATVAWLCCYRLSSTCSDRGAAK